jgi:hypothetical protein
LGIVPPKYYDKFTILDTSAQRFAVGDPLRQRYVPLNPSHADDELVHLLVKVNIIARNKRQFEVKLVVSIYLAETIGRLVEKAFGGVLVAIERFAQPS